jgi:hypothetical protein
VAVSTIFPVSEVRTLTLLVIWILQFMPASGLLIVATLGITNDVSGGFITSNTSRHYRTIFNELVMHMLNITAQLNMQQLMKLLCYVKVESFSKQFIPKKHKSLGSKFTNFVILRNVHTI